MSAIRTVSTKGDRAVEIVVTIFALVTGLAVLGGASINWGVDTTDSYPDDHQR